MIIKRTFIIFGFICLIQFFSGHAFTVEPDEILKDQQLELRARDISKNIRCMTCQNQSIDESDAPLAKDLRILVRDLIKKGYQDKEIYNYLTDRYGDFILLKPPLKTSTYALWLLPIIFLIIGIFIIYIHQKRSEKT